MVKSHILDVLTSSPRIPVGDAKRRESDPVKAKGRKKRAADTAKPAAIPLPPDDLRRDLAHSMVRCTTFYSLEQNPELIEQSSAFLEALIRLWRARGIDPEAVWREIDHRVQLGNLLNAINRDMPSGIEKSRKFWRPSSTKLP